ncbi:MAG: hypothetical protein GXX96_06125 [Planctomycetaceae bacterium]|nr:hypothetical protein [Planctomycetaceae bacterium]
MNTSLPDQSQDPFRLQGKNPKRVAPAVRRNIRIQRQRIRGWIVSFLMLVVGGVISIRVSWIPNGTAVFCLVLSPFCLFGALADRWILVRQRAKLAECERLIVLGEDANRRP